MTAPAGPGATDPGPAFPAGPGVAGAADAGGFAVSPAALATHAGTVEALAGRIDDVAAALAESGFTDLEPYGALCSPVLVPVLDALFGGSDSMVAGLGDLGHARAEGLRRCARTYQEAEEGLLGAMGGAG